MNNTRIEKDFYFQTALHFAEQFWINSYDITVSIIVETDDVREQNIAMERVVYYLKNVIQNCILVDSADRSSISRYLSAGIRVCEMPDEPWDQIFANVLILKLNAIMEDRLKISDLVLGSAMSDGVRYSVVSEVAENNLSGSYWWNLPCLSINQDDTEQLQGSNVVKLFDDSEWVELGLSWKEKHSK